LHQAASSVEDAHRYLLDLQLALEREEHVGA
jgi:hypothetical protein